MVPSAVVLCDSKHHGANDESVWGDVLMHLFSVVDSERLWCLFSFVL